MKASGLEKRQPFGGSLCAISLEDRMLVLEAEEGTPCRAGERVRQHLLPVPQDKPRTVQKRRREVPELHPSFCAPAEKLHIARVEVFRTDDRCRAAVT